jgi:hypothetical protein
LKETFQKHPFEVMPIPNVTSPWIAQKEEHTMDANRAEESLLVIPESEYVFLTLVLLMDQLFVALDWAN